MMKEGNETVKLADDLREAAELFQGRQRARLIESAVMLESLGLRQKFQTEVVLKRLLDLSERDAPIEYDFQ
jgi:hypothetical protein